MDEIDASTTATGTEDKPRCSFYLARKKRLCRMHPLPNQPYCAEHIPVICTNERKSSDPVPNNVMCRQPCPLDPKHTVAVGKLEEHLRKCNSRPPADKEYYLASANSFEYKGKEDRNILTMTPLEKIRVIQELIQFRQELSSIAISNNFGIHECLMPDFVRSDVGESAVRHLTQIGSIAQLMDAHGLLKENTCFIEFGSGRGGLSFGLAKVVKAMNLKNCKFILVDRSSPRYKKENLAKRTSEFADVKMERIKVSIENLLVGKLPEIADYEHIVGITKHLCGSGTDVALRSLLDEKSNCERRKVRGLVFATCCHHRTEYSDLFGNKLLNKAFSHENFRPLRQIAAWATNGDYCSSYLKDKSDVPSELLRYVMCRSNWYFEAMEESFPDITLKTSVGRLAKEVLDICRASHIERSCSDLGLKTKLVNYVDSSTTRENVAILAH